MQKKWMALALVLSLLLVGCGKKDAEEPSFDTIPQLTEAPQMEDFGDVQWDVDTTPVETFLETLPLETAAETTPETEAPTEPPTEPKKVQDQKVVDETVYAVAKVNVRSAPGFNGKVLGQLKGGETVKRTGIGAKWSEIIFEGKTAYVANNYVTTDSPESAGGATFEEVRQTVKATAKVNIRSGPGVDYDVIGQLQAGEEVKRTAIGSKGWSRILYNDKPCYVSNNYLKTIHVDEMPDEKETAATPTEAEG